MGKISITIEMALTLAGETKHEIIRKVLLKKLEKQRHSSELRKIHRKNKDKARIERKRSQPDNRELLILRVRRMRRNPTAGELAFGNLLLDMCINFKRQKIFYVGNSGYIVDFYVPNKRVVFEIDGNSHDGRGEYDQNRTSLLIERGVRNVVRFTNVEILRDKQAVIEKVKKCLGIR